MKDCDECGFPNPDSSDVVTCRSCGAGLPVWQQSEDRRIAWTGSAIRLGARAFDVGHRLRIWRVLVIGLLGGCAVVVVGVLLGLPRASFEPSQATQSSYDERVVALMLLADDRWSDLGIDAYEQPDLQVELIATEICCDPLGSTWVEFEAALPPLTIEASRMTLTKLVGRFNLTTQRTGVLGNEVVKAGRVDEPLGFYGGLLIWADGSGVCDGDDYWDVGFIVQEAAADTWTVQPVFRTRNDSRATHQLGIAPIILTVCLMTAAAAAASLIVTRWRSWWAWGVASLVVVLVAAVALRFLSIVELC